MNFVFTVRGVRSLGLKSRAKNALCRTKAAKEPLRQATSSIALQMVEDPKP